jgi:DNA polymerase-1
MIQGLKLSSGPKAKVWKGVAGGQYTLINTLALWKQLRDELMIRKLLACDTETTGLDFTRSEIVGFSFSWGAENSYYIPIRHTTDCKQIKIEDIRDDLKEIFNRHDLSTIWHNAKFDLHFLWNEGLLPNGVVHDTLILHKLLMEEGSAELKDLSCLEIHPDADMWEVVIDNIRTKMGREKIPAPLPGKPNRTVMRKKANVHYGMIDVDNMCPYAASDVHYAWILFKKKFPQVAANPDLRQLYLMESRLLWTLLDTEHRGVLINRSYLDEAGPKLEAEAAIYEAKVREFFDDPELNVGSTKELITALQSRGIRWGKKTPKNKPSLDVEVLENLATKHQVCADIVSCRQPRKLKSTYVDNIRSKIDGDDYLHCSYNQNLVTGRMSSSGPNLQNIPGRTDTIRKAFICPDGFVMVFIDYSQIELRMTAHYSQDPILMKAYTVPPFRDVHTNTMCEVFDYDYHEAVDILVDELHPMNKELSQLRKVSKIINFLTIYGGGSNALKAAISTPKKQFSKRECQVFIDKYFEKLRVLQRWIGREKRRIMEDHEGQNHFGRYRRFPILENAAQLMMDPSKKWMVERAKRQWVNFLIQGTCADLFKIAMVRVDDLLRQHEARSRQIMVIHDEIVFYFHRSEIGLLGEVKETMEDWDFSIPIVADISYSTDHWGNKKELHLAA